MLNFLVLVLVLVFVDDASYGFSLTPCPAPPAAFFCVMAVVLRLMLMRRNHLRRKQHAEHELATTPDTQEVSEAGVSGFSSCPSYCPTLYSYNARTCLYISLWENSVATVLVL
jgi:hypothetical protein